MMQVTEGNVAGSCVEACFLSGVGGASRSLFRRRVGEVWKLHLNPPGRASRGAVTMETVKVSAARSGVSGVSFGVLLCVFNGKPDTQRVYLSILFFVCLTDHHAIVSSAPGSRPASHTEFSVTVS